MTQSRVLSISLPDMRTISSPSNSPSRPSPRSVSFSLPQFTPSSFIRKEKTTGFTYTGQAPPRRDPLHPSPPSLSRRPDTKYDYPGLEADLRIPAKSKHAVDNGFEPLIPSPHILATHDVHPADISRLLEDCHLVGQLGANKCVGAFSAPTSATALYPPGMLPPPVKKDKPCNEFEEDVMELLEIWDEDFFLPRKLHVSLEKLPSKSVYEQSGTSRSSTPLSDPTSILRRKSMSKLLTIKKNAGDTSKCLYLVISNC